MKKITTQIDSQNRFKVFNLKEVLKSKDLLYFMIRREVIVLYKQTVLGFLWAIIRPLFSMIVFTIVFGNLANIPSDGIPYPLFSYIALVPWNYFSTAVTKTSQSLVSNKHIFTKVYFPKIILPLVSIISGLVEFFIGFFFSIILLYYYNIIPGIDIIFLPIILFLMVIFSSAVGFWLSSLSIKYRDVSFATFFIAQLLMYAAPVVWPVSLIAEKYGLTVKYIYAIYPMAGVIEGVRSIMTGQNNIPWDIIGIGYVSSIFMFITGLWYFSRNENTYADLA